MRLRQKGSLPLIFYMRYKKKGILKSKTAQKAGLVFCAFFLNAALVFAQASEKELADKSQSLIAAARSLIGRNQLKFEKAGFNADCSGMVMAAYYLAGFDIRSRLQGPGNATAMLYRLCEKSGFISRAHEPQAGMMVFFDNTYDMNRDGKDNDILTHVGLVSDYNKEAKIISFVHFNTWHNKIVEETMSLEKPQDRLENTPLRSEKGVIRYAGELWRAFGSDDKPVAQK